MAKQEKNASGKDSKPLLESGGKNKMQEFSLLEGEKIIEEFKPLPRLKTYMFATSALGGLLMFGFFGMWFVGAIYLKNAQAALIGFIGLLIIIVLWAIFSFILAAISYKKYHYWITNKRIITKRGIIGYQISSIPYERVSDIIISRTFLEMLFGIPSLHVQSLAGQFSGPSHRGFLLLFAVLGGGLGAEGQLLAIPNPEETQRKIFELVKSKRKEEGLTF